MQADIALHCGDAADVLRAYPDSHFDCVITSVPYWGQRDYEASGAVGLEPTVADYLAAIARVFRQVHRTLATTGTLWVNAGDGYNNRRTTNQGQAIHGRDLRGKPAGRRGTDECKEKDLLGLPWAVAFMLRDEVGFFLRQEVIWNKPNSTPETMDDRLTKGHEHLFLLTKSPTYHFNRSACPFQKSVWTISKEPFDDHPASFPESLVEPCVLAGSRFGDLILDPFAGRCTTGSVALKHGRRFVGIDVNPTYLERARHRLNRIPGVGGLFDPPAPEIVRCA